MYDAVYVLVPKSSLFQFQNWMPIFTQFWNWNVLSPNHYHAYLRHTVSKWDTLLCSCFETECHWMPSFETGSDTWNPKSSLVPFWHWWWFGIMQYVLKLSLVTICEPQIMTCKLSPNHPQSSPGGGGRNRVSDGWGQKHPIPFSTGDDLGSSNYHSQIVPKSWPGDENSHSHDLGMKTFQFWNWAKISIQFWNWNSDSLGTDMYHHNDNSTASDPLATAGRSWFLLLSVISWMALSSTPLWKWVIMPQ
jgi:hypothetical protein